MSKFDHVESPTLRGLLAGSIAPTTDLLGMAVDLTYLQNEYSERCDSEDFDADRWEEMQQALRAVDAAGPENHTAALVALRGYWSLWERFSTIY